MSRAAEIWMAARKWPSGCGLDTTGLCSAGGEIYDQVNRKGFKIDSMSTIFTSATVQIRHVKETAQARSKVHE